MNSKLNWVTPRNVVVFAVCALLAYSWEARAETTVINDVESFTFSDNRLVIQHGAGTIPDPEPEPEPGAECGGAVRCTYDIGNWSAHSGQPMTVPRGVTLSSKFVTSADKGRFDMVPSPYSGYPVYSMWVSDQPGGTTFTSRTGSISSAEDCGIVTNNLAFNLFWSTANTSGRYCELQSGKTYYINLRHGSSDVSDSKIERRLK